MLAKRREELFVGCDPPPTAMEGETVLVFRLRGKDRYSGGGRKGTSFPLCGLEEETKFSMN